MKITFMLEKKHLWLLILLVLAVGFVVAYGTNDPKTFGHSMGETEGLDVNNDGVVDKAATAIQADYTNADHFDCSWKRMVTHEYNSCPKGYYVAGLGTSNFDKPVVPSPSSTSGTLQQEAGTGSNAWTTTNVILCCKLSPNILP